MKKILIFVILLVTFSYLMGSYWSWHFSDFFRVVFFDVGQGDSILVVTPGGKTILIDGGPDRKVLRSLGRTLPFWQRTIDLLVITHAHDDHTAGLIEVNRRYKIKNILYNNLSQETPVVQSLIKIFKKNQSQLISAQEGLIFNFDNNCSLSVLSAIKEIPKNDNDYSIVTMFNCLNRKVLFSGDAGTMIEKNLLTGGLNLKSDILKVAHHGSLSANSQNFLENLKPQIAVISVGKNNKFNHPAPLILDRLRELSVDIYRTDISGEVEFMANASLIKLIK